MATATASAPASAFGPSKRVPWWVILLQGVSALILGVLLLLEPKATAVVLIQFLGIWWLVGGIFDIIGMFLDHSAWGWKLISGIIGIIAGIAILNHPLWATVLVPTTLVWLLGIGGVVIGILNLIRAFQGGGWGTGILGILSILFGVYLMTNPLAGALALPIVLGVFGVVGGIAAIVMSFRQRSETKAAS